MSLLRRFVIRAAQELGHNPKARAKASQMLEEDVKPPAKRSSPYLRGCNSVRHLIRAARL